MTRVSAAVAVWCVTAAVLAVVSGRGDRTRPAGVASSPATVSPDAVPPSAVRVGRGTPVGELAAAATEVADLPDPARSELVEQCFTLHPDADPVLSPDRGHARIAAAGSTGDAAVVVWTGPAPDVEQAIGSCVGVRVTGGWELVGRGHRPDEGVAATSVAWHPTATEAGAAGALTGRVGPDSRRVLVELEDGRVFGQDVHAGAVAIAWTPVAEPVDLVVVDAEGDVLFAGRVVDFGR